MHTNRIAAVVGFLKEQNLDALLVTNFYSILYLTGLKTLSPHEREAYLLITKDQVFLFTDGRYEEQFQTAKQFTLKMLTVSDHILKQLQDIAKTHSFTTLGFEREDLRWNEHEVLKNNLAVNLVPVDRLILRLRATKDKKEVNQIARACAIGDGCLTYIKDKIRPGMTEKQIAWEMEKWVKEQGYEFSFEPIVAVAANAALPHYNTKEGRGKVETNSLVLIDMGVKFRDYCSDITRVFFMGEPAPDIRAAYLSLLSAQEATVKKVSQVKELRDADLFCRGQLEKAGYPTYSHSTGHGVGLEVHEYPKMSATSQDRKTNGQVVTVEPGIYLPGRWGMRIEDTVVTENNSARILTRFPKTLTIL